MFPGKDHQDGDIKNDGSHEDNDEDYHEDTGEHQLIVKTVIFMMILKYQTLVYLTHSYFLSSRIKYLNETTSSSLSIC